MANVPDVLAYDDFHPKGGLYKQFINIGNANQLEVLHLLPFIEDLIE